MLDYLVGRLYGIQSKETILVVEGNIIPQYTAVNSGKFIIFIATVFHENVCAVN